MIGVDSYIITNEVTDRNPCYLNNVYNTQTKHFDITYERYTTNQKELNNKLKHFLFFTFHNSNS